jgi:hypothetical protein
MAGPKSSPGDGELALDWSGVSEPADDLPAEPAATAEAWLRRLTPGDRQTVASLCSERRPLLFLVDPRDRWHLVEPRLRITGIDASDIADRPDGEFRMLVATDADPADVAHLLRVFRECRPPRAVVAERLAVDSLSVRAQARLRTEPRDEVNTQPAKRRKNSRTGA